MPFTSDNVAAFATREYAYRTRLAGLMFFVLALSVTTLATFKSQISSITSDYRLLASFDLCGLLESDDKCRDDPIKTKPGACGCGVPDTDTDGDGTPNCIDSCPDDAGKTTSPGACGCGTPDTDADGDGTPDCKDKCVSVLPVCDDLYPYECEGCDKKYYRIWKDCGDLCSDDIDYCINYSFKDQYEYVDSLQDYRELRYSEKVNQTGTNSSNTVWEYIAECDLAGDCVGQHYLDDVLCDYNSTDVGACLQCSDGNEYCMEYASPVPPSNPFFWFMDEATSLLDDCLHFEAATTNDVKLNSLRG